MTKLLRICKISFCVGVGAVILYMLVSHVFFNPTISATRGYYFTYPSRHYSVGDPVLICVLDSQHVAVLHQLKLPVVADACSNNTPYLLKHIVAASGDTVQVTRHGIYINHVLQPNSQALIAYKGIKLLPLEVAEHRLSAEQFFVLGDTEHSYDSRYFGILDKSQIMAQAKLFWPRKQQVW